MVRNKALIAFPGLGLLALALGCVEASSSRGSTHDPDDPNTAAPNQDSGAESRSAAGRGQPPGYLGNQRPAQMLRLVLQLTDDGVVELNRVVAANTMNRRSRFESERSFYRVLDPKGRVLFERGFRIERNLRGEFRGKNGQIEGHHFDVAEPIFSAKVPLFSETARVAFYLAADGNSRQNAQLLGEIRR